MGNGFVKTPPLPVEGSVVDGFFAVSDIVKKGLLLFLLVLPFQQFPTVLVKGGEDSLLLKALSYADETVSICLFVLLLSFKFVRPEVYRFHIKENPITIPLAFVVLLGFLSLLWNDVPLLQGAFGIYDLLKNIVVLYLFAALRWNSDDLSFILSGIKMLVMVLAVAAIAGELLALAGREPGYLTMAGEEGKRFGLYRVISLTGKGSTNYLGMYALLGTSLMYLTTEGPIRKTLGLFLGSCLLFLTFSRQAWFGLFIMGALLNRRLILPGLAVLAAIAVMSIFTTKSYDPVYYYRSFAYKEAFHVFLNNPVIGAGPGMFGGVASVMFKSPYYNAWPPFYREMIYKMGSLDSFWPFTLAELGLAGFSLYLCMLQSLHGRISKIITWCRQSGYPGLAKTGLALKHYLVALVVMCFFTGLNKPFVIYTFMALCGMFLSMHYQHEEERVPPGGREEP